MAEQRVVVVGGGLAGLAATMKLAELGIPVDLMSMVPVKRSHSVCAQGGINSVNNVTRQQGDTEWKHFDDTVYGGDFLNHQPPCKEMAEWAPRIIDLLDRLGVPFNRTGEGFRDQRRFGGTLYKRTAFAGATTGQQLLYALDEQVRRWEVEGLVKKYEFWDFLGPVLDDNGVCKGCIGQDMVTMETKAFPADAVILATGGCGLIFGRSTMSMACTGSAASRAFQAGAKYANGEFIQVHPTAIPGTDKLRLMSESARGEGGRVWVPRKAHDERDPRDIPEAERYYFLEERYPEYGNLVPRDIATREIFSICTESGLSVEKGKLCVYLDLTHLPKDTLNKKLGGILEIYEKFQGVDPREVPMKIFPAVHYSMGGLWADYERTASGNLLEGSPRNQMTSIEAMYAIGEVDYHYHGGNRLGANSLLSCIFTGLFIGPTIKNFLENLPKGTSASDMEPSLYEEATKKYQAIDDELKARPAGGENPYLLHQQMGEIMTKNCTVVRHNENLKKAYDEMCELEERAKKCSLSDTGNYTNQNLQFTRSFLDMFPLAKTILKGALLRDECRGSHYKPEFAMPSLESEDEDERLREAETWCDRFEENTKKWLKSTIAEYGEDGEPIITYEDVDTSLIPPRPRLYGLKGAEIIMQVWNARMAKQSNQADSKTEEAVSSS
ncbi:Succinate dehydrogenase flavoprotein subunit [Planctomycetales bacterium 10988]|nr:Succinate dehydrogenase flavoprotein subunit [Planctomycetales bacterium 10988]